MRVVVDTNVLLSALISPHGTSDAIYQAWRSGQFQLITSELQIEELRRASRYPKFKAILQPSRVGTMINNFQHAIILQQFPFNIEDAADPNDAFLVGMSVSGKADYLVTGDRRAGLLQKGHIKQTRILTPFLFVSEVLSH